LGVWDWADLKSRQRQFIIIVMSTSVGRVRLSRPGEPVETVRHVKTAWRRRRGSCCGRSCHSGNGPPRASGTSPGSSPGFWTLTASDTPEQTIPSVISALRRYHLTSTGLVTDHGQIVKKRITTEFLLNSQHNTFSLRLTAIFKVNLG